MELVSVDARSGTFQSQLATYEFDDGQLLQIHFTVAADICLPEAYDHFFILGAAMAFVLGEDYDHPYPVCAGLAVNVRALIRQWCQWYPERREIALLAPAEARKGATDRLKGAFFSGGIDSIFTCRKQGEALGALISIAHVPDDERDIAHGFDRLRELKAFADKTGRRHLHVATNLMEALPAFQNVWTVISHGPALGAVAHFLASEISVAVISSTHDYGHLLNWGSHPLTDPLVSSDAVEISHFGAQFNRVEKTAAIKDDDIGLSVLSVCGKGRLEGPYVNCSLCQKCLRTMTTLDLVGVDPIIAKTFDWSAYSPDGFGDLLLRGNNEFLFAREIRDAARGKGREDIAAPVERSIRRSSRSKFLANAEFYLRRRAPWVVRHKNKLIKLRSAVYTMFNIQRAKQ